MEVALLFLRGDAWHIHASALCHSGEFRGALRAYETAAEIFRTEPTATPEVVAAERAAAFTRHHLGERGEPQRIIRASFAVFKAHHYTADLVRSHIFDGTIDFDQGRYGEARAAFTTAMGLAEALDDAATVAVLHEHLGHCAQLLGDRDAAAHHLTRALQLYEQHGMIAARPRTVQAIAECASDQEFIIAAVREMEALGAQLCESRLTLEAGVARLDALEILMLAGNSERAATVAAEIVETMNGAGIAHEALRALEFLSEQAVAGALSFEAMEDARRALRQLIQTSSS